MRMIICDRCGKEISGNSAGISIHGAETIRRKYGRYLQGKDFCDECIAMIVDFALNGNACDECIREMEENAELLRAADDEKKGSDENKEPDPDEIDWNTAFERMKRSGAAESNEADPIKYVATTEEVAKAVRTIRQDLRCQSEQSQEAFRVDKRGIPR